MFVSADGFDGDMLYLVCLVVEAYRLRLDRISIGSARLQIGVQEKNVRFTKLENNLIVPLHFDLWFYCSCSDAQPMKNRVEPDYPRDTRRPFRWPKMTQTLERD